MLIENLILIISGLIAGVLSGLIGIGGGVVFIPTLLFLYESGHSDDQFFTLMIISTSLFAGTFASISAALNHIRIKNVIFEKSAFLGLGAMISAALVPVFIGKVDHSVLQYFIAAVLSIVALNLMFDKGREEIRATRIKEKILILVGLLVGAISSASGIGGGVFFVPILFYLAGVDIKKSVGTSIIAVSVIMLVSTISYIINGSGIESGHIGYINLKAGFILGVSAVLGSYIGTKLIFRVKPVVIKRIFSVFLLITIIKLLIPD